MTETTIARLERVARREGMTTDRLVEMLIDRMERVRRNTREHMRRRRAKAAACPSPSAPTSEAAA